ncbi:MAG: hypothetical protein H6841_05195 [Planctomycetes bacterium]|nr:hypothetical protein [Planctomycetota bacterium]MCB9935011.1 hypothetical protein [Planctomycetota bacterium]
MAGALRFLAQTQDPGSQFTDPYEAATNAANLPIGAIIVGTVISLAVQVLFGMWGKSAAEEHGVHPVIGFIMGFMFFWLGVKMIPVFRRDRVVNRGMQPQPQQPTYSAPNPMYSSGVVGQQQPVYPTHAPMMAGQGIAPPPPPPPQPPQMLVADAQGYVQCPGCGARTKAGRKTCMSCGGFLPPVYNPHLR